MRKILVILSILYFSFVPSISNGYDIVREQSEDYTIKDIFEQFGYSSIPLEAGWIICRLQPDSTTYSCLTVPQGAVLLFPRPESAPVDSLGEKE